VKLTPRTLRAGEDAIFDGLEHAAGDKTFVGRLYRDGVPSPDSYLAQKIRVLFVFREPNMRGNPKAHDMRDEVRDVRFRPLGADGSREERSAKSWWNWKAGMFAHAVAAAMESRDWTEALEEFSQGGWNHQVVNRFAYIQIKKVGGGGTSNANEIRAHAARYASTLRRQVELYTPHLVLGCGVGRDSPAKLLAAHVMAGGRKGSLETGALWWEFSAAAYPMAMVQLWHPARRGSRSDLYQDVWSSAREVITKTELGW